MILCIVCAIVCFVPYSYSLLLIVCALLVRAAWTVVLRSSTAHRSFSTGSLRHSNATNGTYERKASIECVPERRSIVSHVDVKLEPTATARLTNTNTDAA